MSGLALSLGMMQIARKIPTDRPDVLLALRVTYVCVVLFQAALFYTAQQRIKAKNDTTVLKYQEPPKPFGGSGEPGEPVTTTVRDYDLKQVNAAFSPLFIGVAIMGFMHLKMGYTQPLLIQSVLPIKGLWDNPILKIHIFGKPATGALARPFKAGGGLMDALSAATGASNEAAVPAAPIAAGGSNSSAKITEITDDDAEKIEKAKEAKKTK